MKIPYANRTVDIDLPSIEGQPKITVKGIIDDFLTQLPNNFTTLLEAFLLLSPRRVRATCRSPRAMEEFCHSGLTFRSNPITIQPCKTAKWVTLSRLSYGIPEDAIREALACFGRIIQVKMDSYRGVYIGTRNILMDISKPIPSRVRIAGHWCHIFYPGQTPMCFSCHQSRHAQKDCPDHKETMDATERHQDIAAVDPLLSPRVDDAGDQIQLHTDGTAAATPAVRALPAHQHNHNSGDAPVAHLEGTAPEGTIQSKTPATEKVNDATGSVQEDVPTDEASSKVDEVQEQMDATSGSNKRERADDDSLDDDGHLDKKGKSVVPKVPLSPNRFSALVDEAASLPLPAPDDDEFSPTLIDLPPSHHTTVADATNTPVNDSSTDDESLSFDLNSDNPVDPEHVDDSTRPALDNETLDSPLTPYTPNKPRTEATVQSSSSSLDCFTLGIISKRTRPAPVVGSSRKSSG